MILLKFNINYYFFRKKCPYNTINGTLKKNDRLAFYNKAVFLNLFFDKYPYKKATAVKTNKTIPAIKNAHAKPSATHLITLSLSLN